MSGSGGKRTRLSIAMIVRNAADALRESLESVHAIADEIVVLDTGSTDDTPKIAERQATRFLRRRWDDDFSAARNALVTEVTGDWILWLDAGEVLPADDARKLREFVDTSAAWDQAYSLVVKIPQCGTNIAGEQVMRVRLVRNITGVRFAGRVRESLDESLANMHIKIRELPFRLCRGERDNDPQVKVRKARRNLVLADLEIKEHGPLPKLLNCVGDALQALGDNTQAAAFFQHSTALAPPGSTDLLEAYYGLLTTYDAEPVDRQGQIAVCLKALEAFPLDAQLLCAMGGYLQLQGRLDLATRAYQTASQYGKINTETWHLDGIDQIATSCYALALQIQNRQEDARRVLEDAVAARPDSPRLIRSLIDLYVRLGLKTEALAQARTLPDSMPLAESYRSAIRGACLAHDRNWIAARAYFETAFNAGCREPLCLRWYTVTLLALGEIPTAKLVVDQWRRSEPGSAEMLSYWSALHAETVPDVGAANSAQPITATNSDGRRQVWIDTPNQTSGGIGSHSIPSLPTTKPT